MRHPPVSSQDGPQDEVHIASFVVHTLPAQVASIARDVAGLPGAEVHAATPEGKIVLTLEARGAGAILASVAGIQQMAGVINATLVYQCADTEASMNEELSDAHRPQGFL